MAFEELGIHTMRDAAMGLIAISNLFLSQPIPENDETISVIEEHMKNTKTENIRKAHFEINNAIDSEVCCSEYGQRDKKGFLMNNIPDNRSKIGKWIYNSSEEVHHCSECNIACINEYNYCPNCGAKMENKWWEPVNT